MMKRNWFQGFSSICCALMLGVAVLSCSSGGGGDEDVIDRVKLTIVNPSSSDGYLSVSPSSADNMYDKGSRVTIKAYPSYDKEFYAWTGGNTTSVNPLTIVLNADLTIGASFMGEDGELPVGTTVTVTTSTLPSGIGSATISPAATSYKSGDKVTFTAAPVAGYTFHKWTSGDSIVSYESTYETTLDKDTNLVANYVKNQWTVMVYMDGDNDLEANAIEDLDEMEKADLRGSGINVIALLDRGAVTGTQDDTSNGNWTGTRLIPVQYDYDSYATGIITSDSIASATLGLTANGNEELNMADPATLSNFVVACQEIAQAENYMIIFWDHGTGWRSAGFTSNGSAVAAPRAMSGLADFQYAPKTGRSSADAVYRAVCFDATSDDILCNSEIAGAIKGKGISVIGFDLCLAGMIEVAYELRDCAQYMIASPEVTPADGWEYEDWLESFRDKTTRTGLNLVNSVVDEYYYTYYSVIGQCIAGYDLSKAAALASAFNAAMGEAEAYIRAGTSASERKTRATAVGNAILNTEDYYTVPGDLNIDIGNLPTLLAYYASSAVTSATRSALSSAVTNFVVAKWYDTYTSTASAYLSNASGTGVAVHVVPLDADGAPDLGLENTAYCVDHASFSPLPVNVPAFVDFATSWCPNVSGKKGLLWLLFGETALYTTTP